MTSVKLTSTLRLSLYDLLELVLNDDFTNSFFQIWDLTKNAFLSKLREILAVLISDAETSLLG